MLITSHCPHCRAEHGLSEKLLGQSVYCQKCDKPFIVTETPETESKMIQVNSTFVDETRTPGLDPVMAATEAKGKLRDGRLSLAVPPPPRERWSNLKDGPRPRFPEFRHDAREVRDFLERDNVSDLSWLLVLGLTITTLLVLGFLGLSIYLIVSRALSG